MSCDWPKDLDDSELMRQLRDALLELRPGIADELNKLHYARILADELIWRVRWMMHDAAFNK